MGRSAAIRRVVFAACAFLVGAGTLYLLTRTGEQHLAPGPAHTARDAPADAPVDGAARAMGSAERVPHRAAPAHAGEELRVEVVDAGDGKPVSGAEVLFCAAAEKVARTAQERAEYYQLTDFEVRARRFGASALTGSNGVAFLPRTAKGYDTVAARHGHRYGQAGADRDDDVVRIEVQADAMLRVQVVGPDGVGVEGVAVYAVLACCER